MGYYVVDKKPWNRFADPGEKYVCDNCMWTDDRYVKVFGRWIL